MGTLFNNLILLFRDSLRNGTALKKFEDMIRFQGVTEDAARVLCHEDIWSILQKSRNHTTLRSSKSGRITHIDALIVGKCCVELGAGRSGKNSEIDTSVGKTGAQS